MAIRSNYDDIEIEVTITRSDLLERLISNRDRHAKVYAKALTFWQQDLTKTFSELEPSTIEEWPDLLDDLESDLPESNVREYDRAIDMFQLCVTDEIKLDSDSFNKFCRDEWGWKSDEETNKYFSKATKALDQEKL